MKSLEQILKDNGQNPKVANQTGKFEFDERVGGLLYLPPGANDSEIRSVLPTHSAER